MHVDANLGWWLRVRKNTWLLLAFRYLLGVVYDVQADWCLRFIKSFPFTKKKWNISFWWSRTNGASKGISLVSFILRSELKITLIFLTESSLDKLKKESNKFLKRRTELKVRPSDSSSDSKTSPSLSLSSAHFIRWIRASSFCLHLDNLWDLE